MKVGILALQGAFREHAEALAALDASVVEVRRPEHLGGIEALVLPGGESTTISKLLVSSGLLGPVRGLLVEGMPAFGTCAGLILLADEVLDGRPDQARFGLVDCAVRRNAYGTQLDSFEAPLDIPCLPGGPFPGVFIRAPAITTTGEGVEVLASREGFPVALRQGKVIVTTFHPELGGDLRFHQWFLEAVGS